MVIWMKRIGFRLGLGLLLRRAMDSMCVLLIRIWICMGVWATLEEVEMGRMSVPNAIACFGRSSRFRCGT
jgi:hypothetical protein